MKTGVVTLTFGPVATTAFGSGLLPHEAAIGPSFKADIRIGWSGWMPFVCDYECYLVYFYQYCIDYRNLLEINGTRRTITAATMGGSERQATLATKREDMEAPRGQRQYDRRRDLQLVQRYEWEVPYIDQTGYDDDVTGYDNSGVTSVEQLFKWESGFGPTLLSSDNKPSSI